MVDKLNIASEASWAITCDIGGATCDAAFAVVKSPPEVFPIACDPLCSGGVLVVNSAFVELIREVGENLAGVPYPSKFATESARSIEWEQVQYKFDGSGDSILTVRDDFGTWENPAKTISIAGSKIMILRYATLPILDKFSSSNLYSWLTFHQVKQCGNFLKCSKTILTPKSTSLFRSWKSCHQTR